MIGGLRCEVAVSRSRLDIHPEHDMHYGSTYERQKPDEYTLANLLPPPETEVSNDTVGNVALVRD